MVERKKDKKVGWSYYVTEPSLSPENRDIENREVMRRCLYRVKIAFLFLLAFVAMYSEARPFDVDGFKDGMSRSKVREIIDKGSFNNIEEKDTAISAYDLHHRFYAFNFCKSKLVHLQKYIKPSMKHFIGLFDKLNSAYGKPIDCYVNTPKDSYGESYSISFIWKKNLELVTLTYKVFPKNDQLYITYEAPNECYGTPYFQQRKD